MATSEAQNLVLQYPAGFWLRVQSKLADMLLLTIIHTALTAVVTVFNVLGLSAITILCLLAAEVPLWLAYFSFFTCAGRQSFGRRLAGIKVVRLDGTPVGWWRSVWRTLVEFAFVLLVAIAIGLIDYLFIVAGQTKRALHDRISRTQVVRMDRPKQPWLAMLALGSFVAPYVCIFFVIRPFLLQAFFIPSGAMEPTLQAYDRLLVNKLSYRLAAPRRVDIVVFEAPPESDSEVRQGTEKMFIKRLIGLPGDTVEVKDGTVWVDGTNLDEPYVKASTLYRMKIVNGKVYSDDTNWMAGYDRKIDLQPSGKIPPGKYLVLGDNRNNSNDSHRWGLLSIENVIGKAVLIFSPFDRIRAF